MIGDPRRDENRQLLVQHFFNGDERLYQEFLDWYDEMVANGSSMPLEAALIRFHDRYQQVGGKWRPRPVAEGR